MENSSLLHKDHRGMVKILIMMKATHTHRHRDLVLLKNLSSDDTLTLIYSMCIALTATTKNYYCVFPSALKYKGSVSLSHEEMK